MKNYIYDRVSVSESVSAIGLMTKLIKDGWKNLQYVAHSSCGDCRSPEITGNRPMTKDELKEKDNMLKKEYRQDLKELKLLAKKLGYNLTKKD
jgi:positive regulator of sigma E activity